jgi:nickel-dependent lactate racemase
MVIPSHRLFIRGNRAWIRLLSTVKDREKDMAQSIRMAYGKAPIVIEVDPDVDLLTIREPESQIDVRLFQERLTQFLDEHSLDLVRTAVVVADKTRLCDYPLYLPILFDKLIECGAPPKQVSIYIAYGTHGRQSDAECLQAYGAAYRRFDWIHHRCDQPELFEQLGRTSRGTPVWLRKDIMGASCLITFGAISHHYFAGYGGGRKLIFPGLGANTAIYANHGLFLDQGTRALAPGCRPGALDGNPLAEDLDEVESFRPADMSIHGILDSRGRVCDLLVGRGSKCFQQACRQHARSCETASRRRYDLVIASCGGFPKDINFIQSHKAVHHAAAFVRDGGRLVVLAQCRDGIGSDTFLPWFDIGDWDTAFDRLSSRYVGNGGTALAMMTKTRRITIELVTDLDRTVAGRIGVGVLSEEQLQTILDRHQGSMAVIPNAGMLVQRP